MKTMDRIYKEIRAERKEKVTKKDIAKVIKATETDEPEDWNEVFFSKLYQKQGGAYCRTLELISSICRREWSI